MRVAFCLHLPEVPLQSSPPHTKSTLLTSINLFCKISYADVKHSCHLQHLNCAVTPTLLAWFTSCQQSNKKFNVISLFLLFNRGDFQILENILLHSQKQQESSQTMPTEEDTISCPFYQLSSSQRVSAWASYQTHVYQLPLSSPSDSSSSELSSS